MKLDQSFFDAWGGIAGIQHGYPLLLSRYGMNALSRIQMIQKLCCQSPAEVMSLKSKGSLDLTKDADFTLIQPLESTSEIEADALLTRHQRSAYLGSKINIEVVSTWLRGRAVTMNGQLLEEAPFGKFMPRSDK